MSKQLGRLTELGLGMIPMAGHTRTFQLLVRHIGEARTKYEEDRIVSREVTFLKQNLMAPELSIRQQMEFIIRMIYVEMLGHDASFGYIHAVNLTQHATLMARKLGYMASSMFMHKDPDLGMLLVNSLQKDLSCSDVMRICMALVCIGHTVTPEMLPVVLPLVKECLSHSKEIVRKKAIVVLYKLYKQQNINEGGTSVLTIESTPLVSLVERCLSDRDPGVMSSGLSILYKLVLEEPSKFKGLVDSMVNILMLIVTHKVSFDFEYHSVALPWTQIKMLQILSIIGQDDLNISKRIYEVLEVCLARANLEVGQLIGKALIFECVRTISSIYPEPELIRKAAAAVGHFLSSPSNNIKYFGITSLSLLVQVEAQHALEHQDVIMRCIDDPDDTLKRKTLELLCRITGPENVSVICSKLIEYLECVTEQFIRGDLAGKITEIAEKHAPDHDWFLVTVSRVFRLAGDLVAPNVAHNLMRLIAEGTESGDADAEKEFRIKAVNIFSFILVEAETDLTIPDSLIRIVSWVLSEYFYLSSSFSSMDTASRLAKIYRDGKRSHLTQNWIVQSVIKLALHDELVRNNFHTLFAQSNLFLNIDTQQRWNEYNGILNSKYRYEMLHPLDGSCEDLGVDASLSFLSHFSSEAERSGAPPYQPLHLRRNVKPTPKIIEINYKPYEPPTKPVPKQIMSVPISTIHAQQMDKFTPLPGVSPQIVPVSVPQPSEEVYQFSTSQSTIRPWSIQGYKNKQLTTQQEPNHIVSQTAPVADKLGSNFTNYEPNTSVTTHTAAPTIPHEDPKRREANSIFGHLAPNAGGGILSHSNRKQRVSAPVVSRQESPLLEPQMATLLEPTNQEALPISDVMKGSISEPELTPRLVPDTNSLLADLTVDPILPEPNNTPQVQPNMEPEPEPELTSDTTQSDLSEILLNENGSGFAFINETYPLAEYNPLKSVEMKPELSEFPKEEQNFLVSDANIRVTYVKVFKPDVLVLFLVLTNQIQEELTEILFKYQFPSNLRLIGTETKTEIRLDTLTAFASHAETLEVRCTAPAMNPTVSGELSYRDGRKTQQRLFFNLIISIRDLMRPLNLTPLEFQKDWSASLMFKKKKATVAPSGVSNISDFTAVFRQKVNLHEVDKKGNELLFAGNFISNIKTLFHATYNPNLCSADVSILSRNQLLTDSVTHYLEKNLK